MWIVAILFFVLGAIVKYGKLYFLIAGYNTMAKSERDNYDIDGIATVFKNGMWGMALIISLFEFLAAYFNLKKLPFIGLFVAIAIGLPYILLKSNSDQFKLDKKD